MTEGNWPKILVGAPVCGHYEYCWDRFIEVLLNLDYPNYSILLIDNTDSDVFFNKVSEKLKGTKIEIIRAGHDEPSIKMKMVIGRNILCEKALKEGFDYFFNLDQDVIPPLDILKRLVSHGKDIITGIYHNNFVVNKELKKTPVIYGEYSSEELAKIKAMTKEQLKVFSLDLFKILEDNGWNYDDICRQFTDEEIQGKSLIEIKMCGTGCIFVSRKIMENVPFRFNTALGFDDSLFCKEAILKGFKIYADCSIVCEHLAHLKPWNWCNVGNEQMILYGANMFKRQEYKP